MEIEGFPWIFSRKKNLFKLIWFGHWGVTKLFFLKIFLFFLGQFKIISYLCIVNK
jgi:hypothetical protein